MAEIGSTAFPLRVAVIGSGPSGFYAVDALFKQKDLAVQVDMYDRLPTPFGLVRGGVAPDHEKIKSVTKVYDKIAENPNFRFYGNVTFGKDVTLEDMRRYYHQIVYAVGAQTDRHLGIPGEDLNGSHAATEFVGWYNAHPDFRDLTFDLSQECVAVIGNGNVAMDVARILASSYEELRRTDIADYALDALNRSKVREIYIIGRRGPAQAAFTNPELKEFGELAESDVVVQPEDALLDPASRAALEQQHDATAEKNIATLESYAQRPLSGKPKRVYFRFLLSPTEILGQGNCVEGIKLVKNELRLQPDGSLRPHATDQFETLQVGLVFRSIGYKGVPLPGLPFDDRNGIIPNREGRVIDPATQQPMLGQYVVGWIKRGPSGIIGTNKPDSVDTVHKMLEDVPNLPPLESANLTQEAAEKFVRSRKPDFVSYADWRLLDSLEQANGKPQGRPRIKFSRIPEMLDALAKAKA